MSVFPTHIGFWWGSSRGYHNGCCSGVCLQRLHPAPPLSLHLGFALGNHLQLPIPGAAHFPLQHVPPSRNSAEDRRKECFWLLQKLPHSASWSLIIPSQFQRRLTAAPLASDSNSSMLSFTLPRGRGMALEDLPILGWILKGTLSSESLGVLTLFL